MVVFGVVLADVWVAGVVTGSVVEVVVVVGLFVTKIIYYKVIFVDYSLKAKDDLFKRQGIESVLF